MTQAKAPTMPRRKDKDSPQPSPDPVSVKVERSIHRKLKMLAASKDRDLTEYIDAVLREHVETEFPKFLREQA